MLLSVKRRRCHSFYSPHTHQVSGFGGIHRFPQVSGPCTLHNTATSFCFRTRFSRRTDLCSWDGLRCTVGLCNTCSCADKRLKRDGKIAIISHCIKAQRNSLPCEIRHSYSVPDFKAALKTHLFQPVYSIRFYPIVLVAVPQHIF